jgi:hypothetical protein
MLIFIFILTMASVAFFLFGGGAEAIYDLTHGNN